MVTVAANSAEPCASQQLAAASTLFATSGALLHLADAEQVAAVWDTL